MLVELCQLLYSPVQIDQTQLQPAPSAAQLRSLFQPPTLTAAAAAAAAAVGVRGRVMDDREGQ